MPPRSAATVEALEAPASHILLAGGASALIAAAIRLVSPFAPRGLERLIAAAPLAAAFAVIWTLALGLLELGGDRIALGGAAVVTWLVTRALMPRPGVSLTADAARWWSELAAVERMAAGLGVGVALAYAVFLLRYPVVGTDGITYHLGDVVAWIGNGRPGSVVDLQYAFHPGNYPQGNETILTWGTALSRSFVFAGLWSLVMLLLLVGSAWLGLRALRIPRVLVVLGIASICTAPIMVEAVGTPGTDLPALSWLVTGAALVVCSRRAPRLLAPALVALALGVGTKPTVAPVAVAVLTAAAVLHRGRLGEHRRVIALAGALAAVVGTVWYVRNLVAHGSPLWPLASFPGSDPLPDLVDRLDYSLLDRPTQTLEGNLDRYQRRLAGYLALLAAALAAPLLVRRRVVLALGLGTGVSLLIWMSAPFTGAGDTQDDQLLATYPLSTVRFMLPTVGIAAACVVLAGARGNRPARWFVTAALALAIGWNLIHARALDFPTRPSAATLLAAAAAGALAAAVLGRLRPAHRALATPAGIRVVALVAIAGCVAGGAAATSGYVSRHATAAAGGNPPFFARVVGELERLPDFRDGSEPVSMAPVLTAMAAGDTLQHEVALIPRDEPCDETRARARSGWVVMVQGLKSSLVADYTAHTCFAGQRPVVEVVESHAGLNVTTRVYRDGLDGAFKGRGRRPKARAGRRGAARGS